MILIGDVKLDAPRLANDVIPYVAHCEIPLHYDGTQPGFITGSRTHFRSDTGVSLAHRG